MVTKSIIKGFNDQPIINADGDSFEITPYIEAISDFIENCATPITISLQGGWGTGKSSFINLINNKLEPKEVIGLNSTITEQQKKLWQAEKRQGVITVHFNTWQYAQFNMGDRLGISFLSYMTKKLTENLSGVTHEFKNRVTEVLGIVARLSISVGINRLGGKVSEVIKDGETEDSAVAIETLRVQLQKIIKEYLKQYNADRLVIFVDDLDRLNPSVAVSLLEVIKLFLDVEDCVFVLAVDSRVIEEGISREKNFSPDKTKSFLDKMIQVPFKIPVEIYNYQNFLQDKLKDIVNDDEIGHQIQVLIKHSVGSNPRAMKRLINSYYLISKVNELTQKSKSNNGSSKLSYELQPDEQKLLLGIICMQLAFQPLYITFLQEPDERFELLNRNVEDSPDEYKNQLKKLLEKHASLKIYDVQGIEEHLSDYIRFLDIFRTILLLSREESKSESTSLEEEDIEKLGKLLRLSELTSEGAPIREEEMNYKEVPLKSYFENRNSYRLAKEDVLIADWKEFNHKSGKAPKSVKQSVILLLGNAVKTDEHIAKLKDWELLNESNLPQVLIYPQDSEVNWREVENKYQKFILKSGESEETVEFGYHFSAKEGISVLYKVLDYINSPILGEVKVRVTEVH